MRQCTLCQSAFDINSSLKNGSYFLASSLCTQIKEILENPNIKIQRRTLVPGFITDIECGQEYRKLKDSGQIAEDDISLLWNCDGIPVFKSSKCQIWPIQCQIIELEPTDRTKNICVPCIWFGESKPNVQTHRSLVVIKRSSKVYALICSADSVARPLLRNTKQFNGMYGCDFCYHPGGGPYTYISPEPHLRNEAEHFKHAMKATPQQPVMGVKGPSQLMTLNKFQMIQGFVPEYQHSV